MSEQRLYVISKRRREVFFRKVILVIVTLILIAGLSVLFGSNFADAHENSHQTLPEQKYYKSIEIADGDTLWDLAEQYMQDDYDSVYTYIDELKNINGLSSDEIQEGQHITIVYFGI